MKMSKSITIRTYHELMTFLENEKSLTTQEAQEIVSKALKVVVADEDKSTRDLIRATREFIGKYGALEEKPLFLDIE